MMDGAVTVPFNDGRAVTAPHNDGRRRTNNEWLLAQLHSASLSALLGFVLNGRSNGRGAKNLTTSIDDELGSVDFICNIQQKRLLAKINHFHRQHVRKVSYIIFSSK
jgi:hypothetical protein